MNKEQIIEVFKEYLTEVNGNGFDMMVIDESQIDEIAEQIANKNGGIHSVIGCQGIIVKALSEDWFKTEVKRLLGV